MKRVWRFAAVALLLVAPMTAGSPRSAAAQYGDGAVMANRPWDDLYAYVWLKFSELAAWGIEFVGVGVQYDDEARG